MPKPCPTILFKVKRKLQYNHDYIYYTTVCLNSHCSVINPTACLITLMHTSTCIKTQSKGCAQKGSEMLKASQKCTIGFLFFKATV